MQKSDDVQARGFTAVVLGCARRVYVEKLSAQVNTAVCDLSCRPHAKTLASFFHYVHVFLNLDRVYHRTNVCVCLAPREKIEASKNNSDTY